MIKKLILSLVIVCMILLLALGVKGQQGNPIKHQAESDRSTEVTGPFESSNSNARYALTETIVKTGRFYFTDAQARFAAPDIVHYNNHYFSIFTPGISFIGVPFYMLGQVIGLPQIITFLSTTLIALINAFLIAWIIKKLGGNIYQGIISGAIFLFGTNALSYAFTFTQHHGTTLVILLLLLNVLSKPNFRNNIAFGALIAAGILFDIPNIFIMAPIGIYKLFQHFDVVEAKDIITYKFKTVFIFLAAGFIPLIALFGYYNYTLTDSYTLIGQTIGRAEYPVANDATAQSKNITDGEEDGSSPLSFTFNTRRQLNGFYTLITSDERGIFYYSPVLLLGVVGLIFAYRKNEKRGFILLSATVVGITILLYAMFVDPWGGWAFGPRYLIPAAAILSIFMYYALAQFQSKVWFMILFVGLAGFSIWVNTLGAMTTAAIPPKVEAVNLLTPIPYTYEYNLDLVEDNRSSSLMYNLFAKQFINLQTYITFYTVFATLLIVGLYAVNINWKKVKLL